MSMNVSTSGAKRHDDERVDHRALHAALERVLLLDLDRDAVEHGVEGAGRLARLDHRHEEPVEDLRMPRERLREHHPRLDVGADLGDHLAQVLVVRLLLERRQSGDDADPGLDHRRELAGEDLQRLRLDLLEPAPRRLRRSPPARAATARSRPRGAELLAGRRRVGGVDLAAQPEALGVDCVVGECGHSRSSGSGSGRGVEGRRLADIGLRGGRAVADDDGHLLHGPRRDGGVEASGTPARGRVRVPSYVAVRSVPTGAVPDDVRVDAVARPSGAGDGRLHRLARRRRRVAVRAVVAAGVEASSDVVGAVSAYAESVGVRRGGRVDRVFLSAMLV